MENKDYTCLQCKAPLRKMGKYWVCDTCRIVDVDASGYKTTRESVTSKEGEIAVFLKRTCDALEKYNEVFREERKTELCPRLIMNSSVFLQNFI